MGPPLTVRRLAPALPVVFVAHVVEEAPGFVPWFNSLARPPITFPTFLSVNLTALVISAVVVVILAAAPDEPGAVLLGAVWIGFLMLANGLFHLVATVVHARYCPGVVTSVLLYLPYSALFLRAAGRLGLPPALVGAMAALGALPMLVHGYLIVFQGGRLF